jgi:hypothetical protein
MDDRERFARNALFCRKRAAALKDPAAIGHWTKLAEEYERLALNPAAAPQTRARDDAAESSH